MPVSLQDASAASSSRFVDLCQRYDLLTYNDGRPRLWYFCHRHVVEAVRAFNNACYRNKILQTGYVSIVLAYVHYFLNAPCWEDQRQALPGVTIGPGCVSLEALSRLESCKDPKDLQALLAWMGERGLEVL